MTRENHQKLSHAARSEIDRDLAYASALRKQLANFTCAAIAERHNVTESCIKQYKQGKTYKK